MRKAGFGLIGIAVFLVIAPASAHHSPAAKFDPAKPVTLTGVVTQIDWLNPHVHILMNAQGTNPPTNWAIELESVVDLRRSGWTRDTLKIGDAVTVQGMAARDGTPTAWGNSVVVNGTGRRVFTVTSAQPPSEQAGQTTPRWPEVSAAMSDASEEICGPATSLKLSRTAVRELTEETLSSEFSDAIVTERMPAGPSTKRLFAPRTWSR